MKMSLTLIFVLFLSSFIHLCYGTKSDQDNENRLRELEKRLNQQDEVIKLQNRRMQTLEENDIQFRNAIESLNEIILKQDNALTRLKRDIITVKNQREENKRKVFLLNRILEKLEKTCVKKDMEPISTRDNDTAGIKSHSEGSQRQLHVKRSPTAPQTVAFYAYMSKTEPNPGQHHTLVFDVEKVDIGGGYNPFTGTFTVPVDGVYGFSYTIRVYCHAYASVEIVKNGIVEGAIVPDAEESCDDDTATVSVVMTASKGNVVFIRTHSSHPVIGGIHSTDWGRSSFSGWLIGYTDSSE